jgi:integrase
MECYEQSAITEIQGDWLKKIVDNFNHPEVIEKHEKTFYELTDDYIKRRGLAESHARVYHVLQRAVSRYEGFVRLTDRNRKHWTFDINCISREDIEDLTDYLRNESTLAEEYPKLFAKLLKEYPNNVKPGHSKVEARGGNTIIKMRTRLKSLFLWFYEEGYTKNRPFDGVKIGTAKVGTPYYITIEERNKIADTDLAAVWETMTKDERKPARMPLKTLIEQRDIFVFQCFIGCRVGDLLKMTDSCINNGILVYTPHKTKDEGFESFQARVPLHPKALELIEKYRGVDSKGRLFPFITAQRYNDAIKVIFTMAGVTRKVEVRNPKTGENEYKPINEVASSHLARRTFVGNAYFKVSDPNLIGKMSGHVEGSKAFKRYRRIEDETLRNVIDLIG